MQYLPRSAPTVTGVHGAVYIPPLLKLNVGIGANLGCQKPKRK